MKKNFVYLLIIFLLGGSLVFLMPRAVRFVGDVVKTAPVIELNGDEKVYLFVGNYYREEGVIASDRKDGDLTRKVKVGGDYVDTSKPGTYIVTYNVTDSDENKASEKQRIVVVEHAAQPKVIAAIPITPSIKARESQNTFRFDALKVFEFQSIRANELDACIAMREWAGQKAYFSCGLSGQRVIILEGSFENKKSTPIQASAGNFRIKYDSQYVKANFTHTDSVKVEPELTYTFRVAFENIQEVPDIFDIEYGDAETYNKSIRVDLSKNSIKHL